MLDENFTSSHDQRPGDRQTHWWGDRKGEGPRLAIKVTNF